MTAGKSRMTQYSIVPPFRFSVFLKEPYFVLPGSSLRCRFKFKWCLCVRCWLRFFGDRLWSHWLSKKRERAFFIAFRPSRHRPCGARLGGKVCPIGLLTRAQARNVTDFCNYRQSFASAGKLSIINWMDRYMMTTPVSA